MNFQSIIPILYASDINASIRYFVDVLGFANSWTWDETPTFGGVDKGDIRIFFCKDGQGQPGTWLAINTDDIDAYYEFIKSRGANIISPPENYDWGLREMLVETPDGHKIRFGHGISNREKSENSEPASIQITARIPSPAEFHSIVVSVGWTKPADAIPESISSSAIAYVVVAEDKNTGTAIGCAFLLSDNAGFYYVKNVMVHRDWQNKKIGTAMMQHLDEWLKKNALANATVYLHTGDYLAPFYKQFGFTLAFSMQKKINESKQNGEN